MQNEQPNGFPETCANSPEGRPEDHSTPERHQEPNHVGGNGPAPFPYHQHQMTGNEQPVYLDRDNRNRRTSEKKELKESIVLVIGTCIAVTIMVATIAIIMQMSGNSVLTI